MIELNQGDTESIPFVLKQDGVGIDLTRSTVSFVMKMLCGSTKYTVSCVPSATVSGTAVPYSSGGVSVPLTVTETEVGGLFAGYFLVNEFGEVKTYPNKVENYVQIRINDAF